MDRAELVGRLREAKVPEAFYEIAGVSGTAARSDAYYFLRPGTDAWVIGLSERSQDRVLRRHAAESDACADFYDTITHAVAPPTGPAESLDALLADSAESRRQAWADFDEAGRPEHDTDHTD